MKIEQSIWTEKKGWAPKPPGSVLRDADLVLLFGCRAIMRQADLFGTISATFPSAAVTGCSTAGEIQGIAIHDEALTCTAVSFADTECVQCTVDIKSPDDSFDQGATLARQLAARNGLAHILLLSDGLHVNGTELLNGMQSVLHPPVTITGGLAADGERFEETYVVANGIPAQKTISAIGLYSKSLRVGYGSYGGWDPFGPERLITHSSGNKLYELDGMSALDIYKKYLGEYADDLPASALLFPLAIRSPDGPELIVRTILGIGEDDRCLVFAGDVPEGHYARFMKCNMDRLIDGATTAAEKTVRSVKSARGGLAILISCVGRRMVLRQRAEEELETVQDVLGPDTVATGFYSYGEISPIRPPSGCELLNQTMTITTLSEPDDA